MRRSRVAIRANARRSSQYRTASERDEIRVGLPARELGQPDEVPGVMGAHQVPATVGQVGFQVRPAGLDDVQGCRCVAARLDVGAGLDGEAIPLPRDDRHQSSFVG